MWARRTFSQQWAKCFSCWQFNSPKVKWMWNATIDTGAKLRDSRLNRSRECVSKSSQSAFSHVFSQWLPTGSCWWRHFLDDCREVGVDVCVKIWWVEVDPLFRSATRWHFDGPTTNDPACGNGQFHVPHPTAHIWTVAWERAMHPVLFAPVISRRIAPFPQFHERLSTIIFELKRKIYTFYNDLSRVRRLQCLSPLLNDTLIGWYSTWSAWWRHNMCYTDLVISV